MWILILCLLAQHPGGTSGRSLTSEGPPSLVVHVVDQLGLPMPGALVRLIPAARAGPKPEARTGIEGYAQFWLPPDTEYSVEALLERFKAKPVKGVRIAKRTDTSPTAHVQVQLIFSGPTVPDE